MKVDSSSPKMGFPPNSIWNKIGPLTFLMVMIYSPKVNNTILDRFSKFLSCQNYFLTLWEHETPKTISKSPKYALFWCFKAYSGHFHCISASESITWDNFLSAVCPSIFHISSRSWPRVVWNVTNSNNSMSKSRGAIKNRRAHCGKEIVSSYWF